MYPNKNHVQYTVAHLGQRKTKKKIHGSTHRVSPLCPFPVKSLELSPLFSISTSIPDTPVLIPLKISVEVKVVDSF